MKKLLTLGLFSILLMSCNNTGNGELFPEGVNQTKQSEMKASARESDQASLEDAILATLKDENIVAINDETLQVVYRGELLKESNFENNTVTNPEIERKVKTVCKSKDVKSGNTVSIVHVYDDHYSGYEMVITNPKGMSSSSQMGPFAIFSCPSVWSLGWF